MIAGAYVTLHELKEYMSSANANYHNRDDDKLVRFIVQASRKFDSHCRRRFFPMRETRYYDHPYTHNAGGYYRGRNTASSLGLYPNIGNHHYRYDELDLDDDLLEAITVTTNNGSKTIAASDYYLTNGDNYNNPPFGQIKLKSDSSTTLFEFSGTPQKANAVTGFWGYHEQWDNAWVEVDSVQADIAADATEVTVADADGPDEYTLTTRFSPLQLIRFGAESNSEYALVTRADWDNDRLTVVRGVNGTTAAAQESGTPIYAYRVMDDIKLAMLSLATWAYRRRDNIGTTDGGDQPIASSTGVILMPPTLPGEVKDVLKQYVRTNRLSA